MENIGETLRKTRTAKGISYEEIEKNTKIRRRYLEALENEEWGIFPGNVYLRGFMKTYCRYLGLDETEALIALDNVLIPRPEAQPLPEKIELPGYPRRKTAIFLGIIAVILLLASHYVYQNYYNKEPVIGSKTPPQQNVEPAPGPVDTTVTEPANQPPEPSPAPPVIESISLRIRVIENRCWVRVTDGRNIIYEGTLQKGEEKVFSNLNQVTFTLGNARDTEVYLNDQNLGALSIAGEVVTKRYVLENNEIKELKP